MPHETTLIAMLAVGLAYAFLGGIVAVRLGLPPLVGYLLAGVAVGPFTPGFVGDPEIASQLAEIGVILLMFGVGMHFSISDLWAVRSIALPGAVAQTVAATALGAVASHFWGWPLGAGLVFGLSLSVASTVVLLRALESAGAVTTPDGRIAVGWLIVEDLVMVLTLVLLPALAEPLGGVAVAAHGESADHNLWISLAITLGKVALFVALMLVFGARLFPWILQRVERTSSHELFTVAVAALALGVAFGSAKFFGVSFALGAFFAGIVINECKLSHRAAADLQPLQNAFGALFFVAVGMLFDPAILLREPLRVLAVLSIIVIGKSLAALGIVLALRGGLSTALCVAAALAQIGEFSLAALGRDLHLLPAEGQDLVLAGALLSITLNPLIFRLVSSNEKKLAVGT
jgi:CPA2 family monovalent cation:H+ antiporter-2